MLKSMTAIGRVIYNTPQVRLVVDVQSVNKRFLELHFSLPKIFQRFELDMRKWIGKKISRGALNVRIEANFFDEVPFTILPNLALVRQLKQGWLRIYEELGVSSKLVEPSLLTNQEGVMIYSEEIRDENTYAHLLHEGIAQALDALIAMREQEGRVLYEDIKTRHMSLEAWISRIQDLALTAVSNYRRKLEERLAEIGGGAVENEERLLREICLFAERIDISEEIVRFKSHLHHFLQTIEEKQHSVGKTLDFILQELSREINTIGAKNNDSEVARLVIQCKAELEKIREQVQNVE